MAKRFHGIRKVRGPIVLVSSFAALSVFLISAAVRLAVSPGSRETVCGIFTFRASYKSTTLSPTIARARARALKPTWISFARFTSERLSRSGVFTRKCCIIRRQADRCSLYSPNEGS